MILRENTEPDPRVEEAARQAVLRLEKAGIRYALTGGLLLNRFGAGRPTMDVDLIVPKSRWQDAVNALLPLSINNEKMGLDGEPEPAAILITKAGPFLEIFPQGLTADEIARLRNRRKPHPAGKIAFRIQGNPLVNLINSKLASHLSATDRLQDASDVQRLIRAQGLTESFATQLDPRVAPTFRKLARQAG